MKTKLSKKVAAALFVLAISLGLSSSANAQTDSTSNFDGGVDIYSSYIWRGSKFGSGPAFQPWVTATFGGFKIGAWGSANSSTDEAFEMDLYMGYALENGLSLTFTDYYFGGLYGHYDKTHWLEPMLAFDGEKVNFAAAYMFQPTVDGGDMYFQAGYNFNDFSLKLGAGDGAYTKDTEFMLCNITVGTKKEVEITDKFALPVTGTVTWNPSKEAFYIAVGLSF